MKFLKYPMLIGYQACCLICWANIFWVYTAPYVPMFSNRSKAVSTIAQP